MRHYSTFFPPQCPTLQRSIMALPAGFGNRDSDEIGEGIASDDSKG
jgi:hypothetical protein